VRFGFEVVIIHLSLMVLIFRHFIPQRRTFFAERQVPDVKQAIFIIGSFSVCALDAEVIAVVQERL
jgi:hypothetical protein